MKTLYSATLDLNIAKIVEVEATFTAGLPSFTIVGLASNDIQEARDRVKSALLTNKFSFPPKKITLNLAPSDLASKKGTHFDLPIALSIILQNEKIDFSSFHVFGELGLDGALKHSSNIFPIILSLMKERKIQNILVPNQSIKLISKIPNINIYSVDTLQESVDFFRAIDKTTYKQPSTSIDAPFITINHKKYYYSQKFKLDFADIKAQDMAKRASLIAVAGNHNIIYEGSPGSGKSMSAKRLQYIMPPKSLEEILEVAKNEALDLKEPTFKPISPFRSPHNSSSKVSIFGGGSSTSKIGEIALANGGILFFDEFPHYNKDTLEALREPLEDYQVLISRVNTKIRYDASFLFAAAQNPCPCGNLFSKSKECRCSDMERKRYTNKISEPLLDRIDIYVAMQEIEASDKSSITSAQMYKKVLQAFKSQKQRGQNSLNGKLSEEEIKTYCILNSEVQNILNKAVQNYNLSHRGINKIIKVARTIADIEDKKDIDIDSILEALSYRKR